MNGPSAHVIGDNGARRGPALIATDLDGTLLRPDGSVSERTRRSLSILAEMGIELVFVTARPPRWVDQLADLVGAHGTAICSNGAFVYDVLRRAVIKGAWNIACYGQGNRSRPASRAARRGVRRRAA